jgi:hypothetical protein
MSPDEDETRFTRLSINPSSVDPLLVTQPLIASLKLCLTRTAHSATAPFLDLIQVAGKSRPSNRVRSKLGRIDAMSRTFSLRAGFSQSPCISLPFVILVCRSGTRGPRAERRVRPISLVRVEPPLKPLSIVTAIE